LAEDPPFPYTPGTTAAVTAANVATEDIVASTQAGTVAQTSSLASGPLVFCHIRGRRDQGEVRGGSLQGEEVQEEGCYQPLSLHCVILKYHCYLVVLRCR
jgi:hypothetical protein